MPESTGKLLPEGFSTAATLLDVQHRVNKTQHNRDARKQSLPSGLRVVPAISVHRLGLIVRIQCYRFGKKSVLAPFSKACVSALAVASTPKMQPAATVVGM